jgi:integrase
MNNETYIPTFESVFKNELLDFIQYKRGLGYKYSEKTCNNFELLDRFFQEIKLSNKQINLEIIEQWLQKSNNYSIVTRTKYYSIIYMFTSYLVSLEYQNIIVPENNPYHGRSNFIPYIYSKDEINKIFNFVELQKNHNDNYNVLYTCLCLLYNCGLRISEALNLKFKDFNIKNKTILIEHSKNDVTRIIPLSDTVFEILQKYTNEKEMSNIEEYLFYNSKKRLVAANQIRNYFRRVLKIIGIEPRYTGYLPRIHDLRHTFAVHTLIQMEEKGFDLYTSLPILSTYLGHKSIVETEYYLRLVKENDESILKSRDYVKEIYGKKEIFYE